MEKAKEKLVETNVEQRDLERKAFMSEMSVAEKKIYKKAAAVVRLEEKINYLEESINNGGSLPNSVKVILNNPKFSGIENTIGNLIDVSQEYSLAVSTSLGGASNYLVVDNRDTASRLVDYLKVNRFGRVTFLPINTIKERYFDNSYRKLLSAQGVYGVASELISYNKNISNIANLP